MEEFEEDDEKIAETNVPTVWANDGKEASNLF